MIDPPVPPDTDLRHFPDMPLDVIAIAQSDLAATGDFADNWIALRLWCAAWHQVPAGSLPTDDRQLCYLAGLGRSLRLWKKHREGALHGFEVASDGRQYHATLTRKVVESLTKSRRKPIESESKLTPNRVESDSKVTRNPIESESKPSRNPIETESEAHRENSQVIEEPENTKCDRNARARVLIGTDRNGSDIEESTDSSPPLNGSTPTPFDAFWDAYPEKVGKGAARKAFAQAIRKTDVATMRAAIDRYRAAKPDDRPWANPATWLNQERWLDEYAPPPPERGERIDAAILAAAREADRRDAMERQPELTGLENGDARGSQRDRDPAHGELVVVPKGQDQGTESLRPSDRTLF